MDKALYAFLAVFMVIGGVYLAYTSYMEQVENEALSNIYQTVANIQTYEQKVETELEVSERKITVSGTYQNDRVEEVYVSYATTTLITPSAEPFVFTLSNIATKDRLAFKLERISGDLPSAAPMSPVWHYFTATTIPPEFAGIAVPGPILDILALLRNGHDTLVLQRSIKNDVAFGDPLTLFEYSLAPKSAVEEPAVAAIRERLTGAGLIRVWTDESITSVRYIVLSAPQYTSTTTIQSVNVPFSPPTTSE